MIVRVTQDHIDRGQQLAATECPVALALTSATHGFWAVNGIAAYRRVDQRTRERVQLPPEVWEWVKRYDSGYFSEPFEFDFNWPMEAP